MGSSDLATVELVTRPAPFASRRLRALNYDFAVRTTSQELGAYLDRLFAPLEAPGGPRRTYELVDLGATVPNRHRLLLDGRDLVVTDDPALGVDYLIWHVNREAVRTSERHIVLHAAAAEHQGGAVVIPGVSGAGKSTLVAGLLQRGLRYLTDEVVAVDPRTLLVQPFPKPIAIETGSQGVLAGLRPVLPPAVASHFRTRWLVAPHALRPDAVAPASPVLAVVIVRYEPGRRPALSALRPAAAVLEVAGNCLNLPSHGEAGLSVLAGIARRARCYELVTGELDGACDLVIEMLRDERPDQR